MIKKNSNTIEPLTNVSEKGNMSFPRKWESIFFNVMQTFWIPVFTGMTTFARVSIYTQFKRDRKMIRQILITAIFILSLSGSAYSAPELSIITNGGEISEGLSGLVEVKLINAEDISGFQIFLQYNPAVIKIKDYTINPLFDTLVFPKNKVNEITDSNISGDITLSAVISNSQLINGDTQVVSIEFEGLATGSSDITLLEADLLKPKLKRKIVDSDGSLVVHSAVNSAVTVCSDSDSDNICDYKDNQDDNDDDSDGVKNYIDLCPNTPASEAVDSNGCSASQRDTDEDGVRDSADLCPNTPVTETADANGCSGSQKDDDNDGLTNNLDLCPNTPANEAADGSGCSISQRDSDHDGVNDLADLCPDTNPIDTSDINGCSPSQLNTANAGADQNAATGYLVTLDGSNSSDPEGDIITFHWEFINVPPGSSVTDSSLQPDAYGIKPSFIPDVDGEYILELIINDGVTDSLPDTVTVTATTLNVAPNANAGADQNVLTGAVVLLNGTGSNDPDNSPYSLAYNWGFASVPPLSTLTNLSIEERYTANARFTPDADGDYRLSLEVDDGEAISTDEVLIISVNNVPPNANAGNDVTINLGDTAVMNGSGSNDPDNRPLTLTYQWIFLSPALGSYLDDSDILNADTSQPSFVPDAPGEYLLRLRVSDGSNESTDNVLVTVNDPYPKGSADTNEMPAYLNEGGYNVNLVFNLGYQHLSATPQGYLNLTSLRYLRKFVSTSITSLSINGNVADVSGTATMNGNAGYSFTAKITDNGTPGAGLDRFAITFTRPSNTGPSNFSYSVSGVIMNGELNVIP